MSIAGDFLLVFGKASLIANEAMIHMSSFNTVLLNLVDMY